MGGTLGKRVKKSKKGTSTSSFGTSGRFGHDSSKFYNSKLYSEFAPGEVVALAEGELPLKITNSIILGSSENMKEIPSNSVHLMITSPPYNVTKQYDENLTLTQYLELLEKVFAETFRVLVNGGRACVNLANVGRKPYIPFSDYLSQMMIKIGFNMRGEIIWNKGSSAGVSMAWGSFQSASNPVLRDVHEYILVFSKGEYGRPAAGKVSTITREQFMEWTKSIWTMNTESAKRVGHPAPFPEELPYRLIQLYSFKNDVILDPFMGSGTTALAALKTGRRFVGYDIDKEYVRLAERRIREYKLQDTLEFSEKGVAERKS
jgi:site-specific DNA-methyltransferase (adenine-specific)